MISFYDLLVGLGTVAFLLLIFVFGFFAGIFVARKFAEQMTGKSLEQLVRENRKEAA